MKGTVIFGLTHEGDVDRALGERFGEATILPKGIVGHHDKLRLSTTVKGVDPAEDLRDDSVHLKENRNKSKLNNEGWEEGQRRNEGTLREYKRRPYGPEPPY